MLFVRESSTMTWAPCPHGVRTRGKKSLLSIAAERPTAAAVVNPKMPTAAKSGSRAHIPKKDEAPTTEIFLEETDDQAGTVDADVTDLAEQRAMHTVLRYQMQALRHSALPTLALWRSLQRWLRLRLRSASMPACHRSGPLRASVSSSATSVLCSE